MSEEINNNEEKIEDQGLSEDIAVGDNKDKGIKNVPGMRSSENERRFYKPRDDKGIFKEQQRNYGYRRKICRFCKNKDFKINYRDPSVLYGFITERGKILPRRITGTCAKHQREISKTIKRARILSLLPFIVK